MGQFDAKERAPRILIVDDDPVIRLVACERLRPDGFEVFEAGSGAEAIAAFAEQRASLILLDVEMPGMDGYAVCEAIRASEAGRHVPILILTGRDDVASIELAYESGATDFVMKPIHWLILSHRIRYMLRASESFLAVRAQQVRLDEVQQHARLGSWEIDVQSGLFSASSALRTLVDLGREGEPVPVERALRAVHPEDRPRVAKAGAALLAGRHAFCLEHRILARDGSERIVHTQARLRADEQGEAVGLVGFTQDVTDRRRAEEQVRLLAFNDSLTGLANRTAFKLHLENAIRRADRNDQSLAVLYLDLDQFKRVNDTFGHTAGDRLLQAVADRLRACLRDGDVVARQDTDDPGVMISRLGGDEFTILLEVLTTPNDAVRIAQRVIDSLAQPVLVEGHEIRANGSIGIALFPHDGVDVESLLRNADAAMYHAKNFGRANFQFYRKELNSHALERLELEASLTRAIEHDSLLVHFQPKLSIATRRISGCEALARWSDGCKGAVAPSAFVPLAESSGLISDLGESVLRKACLETRVWQKAGHPDLKLAVNLSPGQIKDERIVETIAFVLSETDFDPYLLEFEITESALIHDAARTLTVLKDLRARGCRIGLDDFGTGYSSLSSLKLFPVQTLKIDRSFVSGIGCRSEDEAIIAAILRMAQSLDIRVVAEGVETEEQLAFLAEQDCDEVQGYLISRALGPAEFSTLLNTYNR